MNVFRLLFALSVACSALALGQGKEPKAPSPVAVSEVVRREVAEGQTIVGTVVPSRRSTVGSAIDGRIVKCDLEPGQAVKKGQPLAQLRTTQLEISLRAAMAELAGRKASLSELRNGSLPEEIQQAAGELAAAAASLQSTRSRYQRAKTLHKRNALTDQQLQDSRAEFDRWQATHSAAKAKHDLLKKGARPEQIAGAEARVAFQDEQISLIKEQIARHTVVAPFDGYVAREMTEIGQWVGRGDPIAEIIELAEVEIEVFVLEKYLSNIRVGQTVQVAVPAVPSEFFGGRVHSIVPQADLRSRSFPVRIRVRNEIDAGRPALKSGMLARAEMPLGDRGERTMLDKDAIVFGGPRPTVYVVEGRATKNAESSVRAVPVELGVMDGDLIEVTGDVAAGSYVVIRGNERLKNLEKVRVSEVRKVPVIKLPNTAGNPGGKAKIPGNAAASGARS